MIVIGGLLKKLPIEVCSRVVMTAAALAGGYCPTAGPLVTSNA
jgi:hypothetical protein